MTGLPWWSDVLTLYHRTETAGRVTWSRRTVMGCYFRANRSTAHGPEYARAGWPCISRIPTRAGCLNISPGDIIVLGLSTAQIDEYTASKRSTDLLAATAGWSYTVREVHDNAHGGVGVPHIYCGGD